MIKKHHIQNIPFFTTAVALVSVSLYVTMAILSKDPKINYTLFEKFGAPYAIQIYDGQYWGLVSNSFIHAFPLHLITNLIGLLVFGSFIEKRIGWLQLFVFGLFASVFTSLVQLALTNDAGLGLSSVNYSLFGLIFMRSLKSDEFKMPYHKWICIFMLAFTLFSLAMNIFASWFIGVEGQISGFLFGAIIGLCYRFNWNWKSWFLPVPIFGIALASLFFAPWSSMWQCSRAIDYQEIGEVELAKPLYEEALEIEPDNKIAIANLNQIQINEWANLAYHAHKEGKFTDAYRYYLRILSLDKNNSWARGNIRALP